MTKRFLIDITKDSAGNLTEHGEFPADGLFVFDCFLAGLEEFAKAVGVPIEEILTDLTEYQRHKSKQ